jgi:hypothetical protein
MITGTTSEIVENSLQVTDVNKKDIILKLLNNNFSGYNIKNSDVELAVNELTTEVIAVCKVVKGHYSMALSSDESFLSHLDAIDKLVNGYLKSNKTIYSLLSGSFRGLSFKLSTAKNTFSHDDYLKFKSVFEAVIEVYLSGIVSQCRSGFLNYH